MNRQCPVPKYQRPLTEYNDLKNSFTFSWTKKESDSFGKNLIIFLICLVLFTSVIITNSQGWEKNGMTSLVQITTSALVMFNVWILRLYLGWKYIYNRLMNATVAYEESGWYDGQTWVKTNEVLIQDRLIGTYEVLPIIERLWAVILMSTVVIVFITYINIQH